MRRRNKESSVGSLLPITGGGDDGGARSKSYSALSSLTSSLSSSSSSSVSFGPEDDDRSSRRGVGALVRWALTAVLVVSCLVSRWQIGYTREQLRRARLDRRFFGDRESSYSFHRRGGDRNSGGFETEMERRERELAVSDRKIERFRNTITTSSKRIAELKDHRDQLRRDADGKGGLKKVLNNNSDEAKKEEKKRTEIDTLRKKDDELKGRIDLLQKRIQRESHRSVVDRFGEGPHYIRLRLRLPKDNESNKENNEDEDTFENLSFVAELAPVSLMPHAVHVFLEQVAHGLWRHSRFSVNPHHVLQVSPRKLKDFRNAELGPLFFQEYSPDFPHAKYTFGFAGRPAGPTFYINKMDNSLNHGPGGQTHHVLEEEGEPCFAKIVEGFNVVDRVGSLPVRGSSSMLKDTVVLQYVELLDEAYVPPAPSKGKEDSDPQTKQTKTKTTKP